MRITTGQGQTSTCAQGPLCGGTHGSPAAGICFPAATIAMLQLCYAMLCYTKSLQSCPTLCDPIDGSPPGSAISGILQARTLEWVAISFTNAWKWKVKVKLLSCTTRGREVIFREVVFPSKGPTAPTHRGQATTKGPQLPCQDTRSTWTSGKKPLHHLLSCQVCSGIAGPGMVTTFPCLMMPQAYTDPKPPCLSTNHY